MRVILPIILGLGLTGCSDLESATDKAGRDAARTIMPEALAIYFPQVPKPYFTAFSNCIVDNADASEVQSLAADAVVGVDEGTAQTIRNVLEEPATQQCIAAKVPADLRM